MIEDVPGFERDLTSLSKGIAEIKSVLVGLIFFLERYGVIDRKVSQSKISGSFIVIRTN